MMAKLWQKGYAIHALIEQYEAGQNSQLDMRLVRQDVWGSLAHAAMLHSIGVLTADEHQALKAALCEILELESRDEFVIQATDEDVHTSVENYLTAKTGAIGKKIHLARSRNDQILVDTRLYAKEHLHVVAHALFALCEALLTFASQTTDIPMPGYTHMRRAMLSSVGLWAASFAEALLDDEQLLLAAYTINDQSPLGSAAGYGVPLPIDRQLVADLLGFSRVQNNVIYAQSSRGKIEAAIVQSLMQIMLDVSKLAQDLLLFTTTEYGFFQVSQEVCTGSSIMPQKRNLDVMELVRARAQTMLALQQQILGIITGLPSGYNMDNQETKRPFIEALDLAEESLGICTLVVHNVHVNTERLIAACTFELFATDRAYELATSTNIPFRDAYRMVGVQVLAQLDQHGDQQSDQNIDQHCDQHNNCSASLPAESQEQLIERLKARSHLGGAGNLGLDLAHQRLEQAKQLWQAQTTAFQTAIQQLVGTHNISLTEE
jgi:argininosuccinate lyase